MEKLKRQTDAIYIIEKGNIQDAANSNTILEALSNNLIK